MIYYHYNIYINIYIIYYYNKIIRHHNRAADYYLPVLITENVVSVVESYEKSSCCNLDLYIRPNANQYPYIITASIYFELVHTPSCTQYNPKSLKFLPSILKKVLQYREFNEARNERLQFVEHCNSRMNRRFFDVRLQFLRISVRSHEA